jgi:hypothetical protein
MYANVWIIFKLGEIFLLYLGHINNCFRFHGTVNNHIYFLKKRLIHKCIDHFLSPCLLTDLELEEYHLTTLGLLAITNSDYDSH